MALVHDKFYVVVPKAATNLITNPSFELGTTLWGNMGAGVTIATTTGQQRRGAQSCVVTPVSGISSGVYFYNGGNGISLTAGTQYSFSADVRDLNGLPFTIDIANSGGTPLASTSWTGTGHWRRKSVTYTAAYTGVHYVRVYRPAVASTAVFCVDGCQLEVGPPSTYFDGDSIGLTQQKDFGWNGAAHASTSYRLARTRAGGMLLDIDTYAKVLSHIGLGRAVEEHTASKINADGELWQAAKVTGRDFIINLVFSGDADTVRRNRKALLAAMALDKTPVRQEMVLRYVGLDAAGEWATDPVDIVCTYRGGLENSATTYGAERCAVQFRAAAPYLKLGGEAAAVLGYGTSVTNFANIGYRDTDGQWKAMGTGVNGDVYCIAYAPDGSVYAGGAFTLAGGVANTAYIAKWNGTAWSALGTGMNDIVYALAIGPDGSLYAGGAFTSAGGVANTSRVAKWNGTAWSALGTGANSNVRTLAFGSDGSLYIGGAFTLAGGVANTAYIAKWNGTAWSALGTGMDSVVYALAFGADGSLYAGGAFALAGGVANTAYIAKWNGTAWSALGTGMNNTVFAITPAPDGSLYAGGAFTLAGGVANTAYIAKWNGTAWSALGTGMSLYVLTLTFGTNGVLFAGGDFEKAGGITLPDRMATYHNGTWRPMDVNVNNTSAHVYTILPLPDGRIYIGGDWSGSTTATSATVTASNNTGAKAYPRITFTGPGVVWQARNYTNGDAVYFKNLTLLSGETAVLDCNPRRFSFVSSWRGNLQSYILPGSSNFALEPGDNNVSAYMTGTTAASRVVAVWQPTFSSIEEALR